MERLKIEKAFHYILTDPLIRPVQDIAEQSHLQSVNIPLETCFEYKTSLTLTSSPLPSHHEGSCLLLPDSAENFRGTRACIWIPSLIRYT